ncbi:hypothetical protein N1851_028479 [Merluccius polli]|uniref:Uncharacterized protein n=1 Tax=Merluccius polli TaxID=89951 RepID=A0AA47NSE5_MERPO|nr:hypothetical protein N1851_028479 [Merluccius polli]
MQYTLLSANLAELEAMTVLLTLAELLATVTVESDSGSSSAAPTEFATAGVLQHPQHPPSRALDTGSKPTSWHALHGMMAQIIAPSKDEDVFVNRKKWPGSTHDSRILMGSGLRQDVALDTLSQSTTGSTVKSTQKYTKCCGEKNWADETSISCPARRNTPQPKEGK